MYENSLQTPVSFLNVRTLHTHVTVEEINGCKRHQDDLEVEDVVFCFVKVRQQQGNLFVQK